jgi:hypothetical protein
MCDVLACSLSMRPIVVVYIRNSGDYVDYMNPTVGQYPVLVPGEILYTEVQRQSFPHAASGA